MPGDVSECDTPIQSEDSIYPYLVVPAAGRDVFLENELIMRRKL